MECSRDLARLRALLERFDRLLALPAARLGARPDDGKWSVLQHVFHVVLANDLSLRNAQSLAAERGRLRAEVGARDPRALAILARGRLPRGTPAPRFVVPPDAPDLAIVRAIHAETRAAAAALDPLRVARAPLGIPHQALGTLTAAEWVRFARMHAAHHLRIVRGMLAAART